MHHVFLEVSIINLSTRPCEPSDAMATALAVVSLIDRTTWPGAASKAMDKIAFKVQLSVQSFEDFTNHLDLFANAFSPLASGRGNGILHVFLG